MKDFRFDIKCKPSKFVYPQTLDELAKRSDVTVNYDAEYGTAFTLRLSDEEYFRVVVPPEYKEETIYIQIFKTNLDEEE
jgi:hypothetical protein